MKDKKVLLAGSIRENAVEKLQHTFDTVTVADNAALDALPDELRRQIRGIAEGPGFHFDRGVISALPNLEIVGHFGVGYDTVDTAAAAEAGVIVTNTPDVLTEEVADTALGLLLMTVREFSASERYLRAGGWVADGEFHLSAGTLRDRKIGIAGLGRIGAAIARRLDGFDVPIAYHTRNERPDSGYRYYSELVDLAREVDTLINILPGGESTRHIVNTDILAALGPRGILINMGRGSTVDEAALVAALTDGTILAAGLDVFEDEPNVPAALMAMENVVLLPHVGSASEFTRDAMADLMIRNLASWFGEGRPLTPITETPWPAQ